MDLGIEFPDELRLEPAEVGSVDEALKARAPSLLCSAPGECLDTAKELSIKFDANENAAITQADAALFSAPSASRINIAKVNIEGIDAPSPLPHCAFPPAYFWHAIALPGWRAMAMMEPWWRRLACPLCECLSWLFQKVIYILHCCC